MFGIIYWTWMYSGPVIRQYAHNMHPREIDAHSYQKVEIWLFIGTALHDKFPTSQRPLIKEWNLSIYSVALYPSARNVGDLGSVPGLGRPPGEGKGYPLQYSGLENSMDYGRSVQFSHSVVSGSLDPMNHSRPGLPVLSPTPGVHPNPSPLSRWCHPTISSSAVPFSSCPQSFPASGSFQISQFFASGGQSIGVSASASVLSVNTQDWSPLGWTGWISLQSKGLSRVFSSTTVWKRQFFGAQFSL